MMTGRRGQRGAALVTVLLFMVLIFILITSMLSVAGNEVVIAGFQRDGVRALELAQAGLDEAVRRMEEGRPYLQGFTSSLASTTTVSVVRRYVGTNSAYQEIRADATAGRATRRLSLLVLQQNVTFPPDVTFAASVIEQGSADITCGDAYSRTFIQYKTDPSKQQNCPDPTTPPTITYAGWRVSVCSTPDGSCKGAGQVPACYQAPCPASANADTSKWYPAIRTAEPITSSIGSDLAAQTNKCPAGDPGGKLGPLPSTQITGVLASDACNPSCTTVTINKYGFDTDDPDGNGPIPPQAVTTKLPCGLPYRYENVTFTKEDGSTIQRLMKKIVFEQWFDNYWQFNESKLIYQKKSTLLTYPQYGAVPPFPSIDTINGNFDCEKSAGNSTISSLPISCNQPSGTSSDLGCYPGGMACSPERTVIVVLDGGPWTINANLAGHGTIVVNGNLTVNGTFDYWGTIIVNGTLTLGAGNATIHGGLVADSTLKISGNITVEGGGSVTNVPTGRSIITGKGWWER